MSNLIINPSKRARTRDSFMTFDSRTVDSTGAFLVSELERLDQTLHAPLSSVTYGRDITLRTDVSMGDDFSSYTLSNFAMPSNGGWIGKNSTQVASAQVDISKVAQNLNIYGAELAYTIPELESAQKLGRPVDAQKMAAINLAYQMKIDQCVYKGDAAVNTTGLINSPAVTATNAVTGTWSTATADQILADVNALLNAAWAASAYAFAPSELLLPPTQFGLLATKKVSDAGNISVLQYLKQNSISLAVNGKELNINPVKWLKGAGASNADRMLAYTNRNDLVRYPLVPMQRTPVQFRGIAQVVTYFSKLGQVELVYPESVSAADGI